MKKEESTTFDTCIFAAKDRNGHYRPDELVTDLQRLYENLEYADVDAGAYQLWDYPSGKIYAIVPDRKLPDSDYSTPYGPNGVVWLPTLKHIRTDLELVRKLSEPYLKKYHSDRL